PRRDHRVEGIGDREDPGFDGDSTSAESRRIAVTVPPLVVEEHIRERVVEPAHLDDEPRPGGRVAADFRYLLGGEPAGLPQHLRPNLDLADVMQWRGPAKCANAVAIPAELERDRLGKGGDPRAVADGVVALLECACDRGEHEWWDSAPGPR